MKRKYTITGYFETTMTPQQISLALNHAFKAKAIDPFHVRLLGLQRQTYMILVPRQGSSAAVQILPGSGIVGLWNDDRIEAYYEGAPHGGMSFEERLMHAADRFKTRYPTIARGVFDPADLIQVGTYSFNDDFSEKRVYITDQKALDRWFKQG